MITTNSSSSLSSFPETVLEIITRSLPHEVQCLVLKHVILNWVKELNSFVSLCQINNLIGYNPTLDEIIGLVLEELDFDESIFSHVHFNHIAQFIISRLISMKHLSIRHDFTTSDEEIALGFIQRFQSVTVQIFPTPFRNFQKTYFKSLTSLTVSPQELQSVLKELEGCFEKLPRLVSLELILIMNPKNIELVKEIVQKWRTFGSSVPNERQKERSLKLSISIGYGHEDMQPLPVSPLEQLKTFNGSTIFVL
ncbi:unnamed protein product [Ambrosiozyma monospora]|uniref:Unnamed protein product n=1 Tax=Ambrosiozyma monospora TaxID=43982 RepID=A0ACB5TKP5_AMBMO|nr:unnamed protein product [Ambrosiozyma monospora]